MRAPRTYASGPFRVLDLPSLKQMLETTERSAAAEANAPPIVRRRSAWDRMLVFYTLGALLGIEWFLRRRWGLA